MMVHNGEFLWAQRCCSTSQVTLHPHQICPAHLHHTERCHLRPAPALTSQMLKSLVCLAYTDFSQISVFKARSILKGQRQRHFPFPTLRRACFDLQGLQSTFFGHVQYSAQQGCSASKGFINIKQAYDQSKQNTHFNCDSVLTLKQNFPEPSGAVACQLQISTINDSKPSQGHCQQG